MIELLLLLAGYLWGGIPTADLIARRAGFDLRGGGSRNPGTNNAIQIGGARLGVAVLLVELVKGFLAAWIGSLIASELGAVAAGLGAVAGNVYNPYFRGKGGKGLAITAGATLGAWPLLLPVLLVALAVGLAVFRASGHATLLALGAYGAAALTDFPPGLDPLSRFSLAAGVALLIAPKAIFDTINPVRRNDRPASPAESSPGLD